MGRITIFSADGCPHSKRTKAGLALRKIPFVEISITQYPQKRKDMIALAHRLSTPQVFFNTRHVGGADETLALLKKWDKGHAQLGYKTAYDRYYAEIETQYDPSNPRFEIPTEPPVRVESGPPRGPGEYSIPLPGAGEKATVLEMTVILKRLLGPAMHTAYKGLFSVVHKNVFTGAQALTALSDHYQMDDEEQAQALAKHLLQQQVIVPAVVAVAAAAASPEDAAGCIVPTSLYRLQCYATPHILNSFRIWREELQGVSPHQLLYHLRNLWSHIAMDMTDDSGTVDYVSGSSHPLYPMFEEAICALQYVSLADMNDAQKTAFGINLYNLMIKYAFCKVGAGDTDYNRLLFFNRVCFNVGGHVYSFQDWENGILRGNRKAPYALGLPFSNKEDVRRSWIVQTPDPRMHFALNCGAQSCPPVNYYTAEDLDHELSLAAAAFCESPNNVRLDAERKEIHLSKIFAWYREDFVATKSNKQYPTQISRYLHSLKKQELERMLDSNTTAATTEIKVLFQPYDWSTGAKRIATFDAKSLKSTERSVLKSIFSTSTTTMATPNKKQPDMAVARPTSSQ